MSRPIDPDSPDESKKPLDVTPSSEAPESHDLDATLDSQNLMSINKGLSMASSDQDNEQVTVLLPIPSSESADQQEAKTIEFESAAPSADGEGATLIFSGESLRAGNARQGSGPSNSESEAQTVALGPTGEYSGAGSFLIQAPTGTKANLMNVWQAAIGDSGMESRRSLRYEMPEASDSILGRVALRLVTDAGAPQSMAADYQILDKLGEGGMGVVYAAIQTAVNRKVALKTLKKERNKDPSARKQFFYEAEITADLDHPNIPPIYEFGSTKDGIVFYTMKMIKGAEWQKAIHSNTQAENLEIFNSLLDAIAFGHSKNIIHRDIKPENVILGGYGEVYVTDWGMAVNVTRKGSIRFGGTPDFMAPEMANDDAKEIGKWSDVYLLGAVLYQIITGFPPHPGKNALERLLAARANKIRKTSIEDPLLDIAFRAMSTKPANRYHSVEDLQNAVREVQRKRANINSSIDLTVRSQTIADKALEHKDYDRFTRAIFGFRDAIELWDGNREAETSLKKIRLAYGQCAFDRGDYDLALATLDMQVPEELMLYGKSQKAKLGVLQREKRFKTLRNTFVAFLGLAMLAASVAAFVFDNQRRIAIRLKNEAEQAKFEEEKAKEDALAAKDEEQKAKELAIDARAEEEIAKNQAIESRAAAIVAQKAAEQSEALARARLAQVELGEQLTKLGFASAQVDQFNPLGAINLIKQLDSRTLSDSLQSRMPRMANWAMNRIAMLSNLDLPKEELSGEVIAIDFSMDKKVGVAGMGDGTVRLLQLENGRLVEKARKQVGQRVGAASISPSGKEALLAVSGVDPADPEAYQLIQWNLLGDRVATRIESTGNRYFQGFGYSPDGSTAVAGIRGGVWGRVDDRPWAKIADKVKGELMNITWLDNQSVLILAALGDVHHMFLLPELRTNASASIVVQQPPEISGRATAIAVVKDQLLIGTSSGDLFVCRLVQQEPNQARLEKQIELPQRHRRAIVQIDYDGESRVVTNSREPVAHVWSLERDRGWTYETYLTGAPSDASEENNIESLAFVDTDRVVNVDSQGVAVAVDVRRQKQRRAITRIPPDGDLPEAYNVPVIGFHSRGQSDEVIAVDQNGAVDVWNLQTGRTIRVNGDQAGNQRFSYLGHTPGADPIDMVVDPASKRILTSARLPQATRVYATSSEHNREFCIWDPSSGTLVRRWSDGGDEPRLSMLGNGQVLINSDHRTHVVDMDGRELNELLKIQSLSVSFAVANPKMPNVIAMFKRTGGSGMAWIWNQETGLWFDPDDNYVEFAKGVPVHGAWSPDGQRLYVLDMAGNVFPYRLNNNRLIRTQPGLSQIRLSLKPNLSNALRSHQDVDFACEQVEGADRLVIHVRDSRSQRSETNISTLEWDEDGKLLSQENQLVEGLKWPNDLREFEIQPATRVLAQRRIGDALFVSMRSGTVYGLNASRDVVDAWGRQPFVQSTADAKGHQLITLHRDGSLLRMDLKDLSQTRWDKLPFSFPEAESIALSPDGTRLAVWDLDKKELLVVSSSDGSNVQSIVGVLGFAWDPVHPDQFLCIHDDGHLVRRAVLGAAEQEITPAVRMARVELKDVHVCGLHFFHESWQEPDQPVQRYLMLHTQSGDSGTISFMDADQTTDIASPLFAKSLPADVKIATSPTDPIFVTGDSTGTLRVWFASPMYRIANQVFDLRGEGDAPIVRVGFDGTGRTLITSDGNRRVFGWMSHDSNPSP
jgi:serine/threonine protein kinase/WD40 repeat protein